MLASMFCNCTSRSKRDHEHQKNGSGGGGGTNNDHQGEKNKNKNQSKIKYNNMNDNGNQTTTNSNSNHHHHHHNDNGHHHHNHQHIDSSTTSSTSTSTSISSSASSLEFSSSSSSKKCQQKPTTTATPAPALASAPAAAPVKPTTKDVDKITASHAPRPLSSIFSIKFLHKNPFGRQLTKESWFSRSSFHKTADMYRAKDDPALAHADKQVVEYVRSIPDAIRYKDLLLQGYLVYGQVLRKIENFTVRPSDIWLCTYPKSGTTWMEEILSLIRADGDISQTSQTLIAARVPHLEICPPFGHMKWLKRIPSPRLLATHLTVDCIPAQLRTCNAKIIYVVRNPKDNAVSYYHHHRISTFLGNYKGTWENFIQLFVRGALVYGDWLEHVLGYWRLAQQYPGQVLFISYEELKINLPHMIEVIANFMGHPISPETIDLIARQCTFEKMKNNTMVNREVLPLPDLFDMSDTKFMRKGIIGDWRNHFSAEESELFDSLYADRLREAGLRLVYDFDEAMQALKENGGDRIIQQPSGGMTMTTTTMAAADNDANATASTSSSESESESASSSPSSTSPSPSPSSRLLPAKVDNKDTKVMNHNKANSNSNSNSTDDDDDDDDDSSDHNNKNSNNVNNNNSSTDATRLI